MSKINKAFIDIRLRPGITRL